MTTSFSVVIPTFNEEAVLAELLTSIQQQSLQPQEVIIADAHSKDATRQIANKFNCEVVDGGKPAEGRNAGAKHATGEVLIFLDADLQIETTFFENVLKKFENKQLDIAACFSKSPQQESWKSHTVAFLTNIRKILDVLTYKILGTVIGGSGWFIAVRKSAWKAVNGFDESMYNHEDTDFVQRVTKNGGKFGLVNQTVTLSGRRFDTKPVSVLLAIGVYSFGYKVTSVLKFKKAKQLFLKKYETTKGPLGGSTKTT